MTTRPVALALAVAYSLAGPAHAVERTLNLEPKATVIAFSVGATGHVVHGSLFLDTGEVRFDLESGLADGEIRVDARKAETGNKKRDKNLHVKVLESERFPFFVFRPTTVQGEFSGSGSSELTLSGKLTIHGDEHDLEIPIQTKTVDGRLFATAEFVVPYVKWGMHRPSVFLLKVAPEVEVRIETTATLRPSAR
jgi:polyisoprenoid-binding protein YceI